MKTSLCEDRRWGPGQTPLTTHGTARPRAPVSARPLEATVKRSPHRTASLIAAIAAGVILWGAQAPATARPATGVQAQITAYLAATPGGTQINATEVSYSGGRFIVTFGLPAATAALVANCPWGWFCFYDQPDYAGMRGRLSDCGWQDLADWNWNDRTVSAYYNMGSGYVRFLDHLAGETTHTKDPVLFTISTTTRGIRLVPYPNRADHVNRYC